MAVIGAGPAGARLAGLLAGQGWRVLLLEKQPLPRDKPCGGGLSPKALRELDLPLDGLVRARVERVRLRGRRVEPFELASAEAAAAMVRRREFDLALAEAAQQAGAVLRAAEPLIGLSVGNTITLETSRRVYRSHVVAGADGANGVVRKLAGLRGTRPEPCMLALEYEGPVHGSFDPALAVLDYRVPSGYGWLFPKGEVVNIGIGLTQPRHFLQARQHLERFIQQLPGLRLAGGRLQGHRIPSAPHSRVVTGRILLVGDAASLADPFWGEGIAYALASARLAASAIDDLLAGRADSLEPYQAAVERWLRPRQRLLGWIAGVGYRAPDLLLWLLRRSTWAQARAVDLLAGRQMRRPFLAGWGSARIG